MTELETLLIEGAISFVEKIATSIAASTSLNAQQQQAALAAISARLDTVKLQVTSVKFKDT